MKSTVTHISIFTSEKPGFAHACITHHVTANFIHWTKCNGGIQLKRDVHICIYNKESMDIYLLVWPSFSDIMNCNAYILIFAINAHTTNSVTNIPKELHCSSIVLSINNNRVCFYRTPFGWLSYDRPFQKTRTISTHAFWGYPRLPILLSHIGFQVKRRQSQSYKFREFAKLQMIEFDKILHATYLLKLIDKMCKYEMDPTSTVVKIQCGHDCVHRRTDGRTR